MKLLIPTLALACTLIGCGASETATNTASTSAETKMEQKKCSACGMSVASNETVQKDGKTFCKACAEAH